MNDEEHIEELLSALVDGELPHAQAERVLNRVLGKEELRERWRRHHLISAALSSQHSLVIPDDELASRVSLALDAEPVPLRGRSRAARRLSWMVGLATAAGVATVAVLVVLSVAKQQSTPSNVPLAAFPASPRPDVPVQRVAPSVSTVLASNTSPTAQVQDSGSSLTRMTWNDSRPAVEARLNSYLLEHNEYLADGVRGMLPYARVVGYGGRN